jgi:haloalkane dehalogenase
MHYLDEKPRGEVKGTVLMIHGNAVWSVIYRKMINPLKEMGFRVIAVDLLGFGMSDKPSLEEFDFMPGTQAKIMGDFIREMDLRDIYLAGQDWGGPIGLDAAASMPERINGILLMNTWAWELGPVAPGKTNPMHVVHGAGQRGWHAGTRRREAGSMKP